MLEIWVLWCQNRGRKLALSEVWLFIFCLAPILVHIDHKLLKDYHFLIYLPLFRLFWYFGQFLSVLVTADAFTKWFYAKNRHFSLIFRPFFSLASSHFGLLPSVGLLRARPRRSLALSFFLVNQTKCFRLFSKKNTFKNRSAFNLKGISVSIWVYPKQREIENSESEAHKKREKEEFFWKSRIMPKSWGN